MECRYQTASSLLVFPLTKGLVALSKLTICKIALTMTSRHFVQLKVFDSFDSSQHPDNHFLHLNQSLAHIYNPETHIEIDYVGAPILSERTTR